MWIEFPCVPASALVITAMISARPRAATERAEEHLTVVGEELGVGVEVAGVEEPSVVDEQLVDLQDVLESGEGGSRAGQSFRFPKSMSRTLVTRGTSSRPDQDGLASCPGAGRAQSTHPPIRAASSAACDRDRAPAPQPRTPR